MTNDDDTFLTDFDFAILPARQAGFALRWPGERAPTRKAETPVSKGFGGRLVRQSLSDCFGWPVALRPTG